MVEEGNIAGLRPGQKVRSIQGRDRGQEYLILGFEGDRFLLVADGGETDTGTLRKGKTCGMYKFPPWWTGRLSRRLPVADGLRLKRSAGPWPMEKQPEEE